MKKAMMTLILINFFNAYSSTSPYSAEDIIMKNKQCPTEVKMPVVSIKRKLDTEWIQKKYLDVTYGNLSERNKLDIYLPNEGEGPFPAIIAIHGGAFKMGDKASAMMESTVEAVKYGYAVISVNYRLSGEEKFPAAVQDVKGALRFIRANSKKYNIDPDKIAAWGGSAGGNLASMLGTTGNNVIFDDEKLGNMEYSSHVSAVVDWFGPTDFLAMDRQFKELGIKGQAHSVPDSPESLYLGGNISEIPEKVNMANPETYISKNTPPFFIQHGSSDNLVPVLQSVEFSKKLENMIGKENVTFEILDCAGHGTPEFDKKENVEKVIRFLDSVLKKGSGE